VWACQNRFTPPDLVGEGSSFGNGLEFLKVLRPMLEKIPDDARVAEQLRQITLRNR
jgi:hypothetical protein